MYRALIGLSGGRYTMDELILTSALQMLSQLLYRYYGQKVILLIDEYDVPLDKAFQHGYYREMVALIRGIFGQALKTNDFLYFAVLTGCLWVSKESIFTGLNNFNIIWQEFSFLCRWEMNCKKNKKNTCSVLENML